MSTRLVKAVVCLYFINSKGFLFILNFAPPIKKKKKRKKYTDYDTSKVL